ncbi:acetamidase regulatory protein [Colletotrichum karsti]|uniref:Acetamidase regulatory protein n=1 Tax=Colletotrichum karsti TaxID=1095194 RepID=A0A9P6LGQ4_9PEZI|nr:acetamidase regulatory protein [Colletotrichum karsti]KAF9875474.1 acetamidase regulatory protein [Colletotrichum karsti]
MSKRSRTSMDPDLGFCSSPVPRKVKCDILEKGGAPCSKCQANNVPDCRIYEKKKTRFSARTALNSHVPIQPRSTSQSATAPATPAASSPWADVTASSAPRPSSASDATARAGDDATRNMADFLNRQDAEYPEITRCGRLFFIGTEFSNLHYLVRQRSKRPDPRVLHFGSHPLAPKVPAVPAEVLELPPKALADELIKTYFVHVNRGLPIIDEEDFMKIYNGSEHTGHFPRCRPQCRPISLLLLNAIFFVGARVLDPVREEIKALRPVFFRRTKALFDSRFEQHRETYLQASLLLTWQCDDLEDIVSNTWHWVGVATRTAFGMGMHRDARPSSLNAMDKRLWVRLWWILFQFDVLGSASNLDESDVPELEEHHFEGITDPEHEFTIQQTRLCIIVSSAMKKRVALRSTPADRAAATAEADTALAELITNLPERLQHSRSDPDPWQAIFHLTYNNFLILLHRPSPNRDHPEGQADAPAPAPAADTDLSICCDAAITICSIFESLRKRNLLTKIWIPSIHMLFTALVHVSDQMKSDNPLIAAKSKRLFDSLILTLHALKGQWLYAQSLLALFEGGNGVAAPNRAETGTEGEGDVLAHTSQPSEHLGIGGNSVLNSSVSNALAGAQGQPPSSAPAYLGHVGIGGQEQEQLAGDIAHHSHIYGTGFVGDDLGLNADADSMDMLQVPSALELLLAGVGNDFGFHY